MGRRAHLSAALAAALLAVGSALPAVGAAEGDAVGPEQAVRAFVDGCIEHEGQIAAVTDWALAQGWVPVDPLQEAAARPLLEGAPGQVLQASRRSSVLLLAVSAVGRCVVWASDQDGPLVRLALLRAIATLSARGARARIEVDRTVEHDGAWRNVMQWSYRRPGGSKELRLGAATTIGAAPAAQALQLAPLPEAPAYQPDGQPTR